MHYFIYKKERDIYVLTAIDQIHLYAKDLNEPKYQLLIKKREDAGIKHLNDPKAFIEYSNTMVDAYNNFDNYNLKRKRKILIVFDDIIADIKTNKNYYKNNIRYIKTIF